MLEYCRVHFTEEKLRLTPHSHICNVPSNTEAWGWSLVEIKNATDCISVQLLYNDSINLLVIGSSDRSIKDNSNQIQFLT